jgi:hypothetical protein
VRFEGLLNRAATTVRDGEYNELSKNALRGLAVSDSVRSGKQPFMTYEI